MRRVLLIVVLLVPTAFFLGACSETSKSPEAQASASKEGPTGPVTGKVAYWAMYKSAYSWSKDAVPLKLESKAIAGIKNEGGNAALWSATFGSASKREALEISYALAPQPPDLVKGLNVGHAVPWAGPTREVMPFTGSDIVADSDAAFKPAAAKAESWLKDNPDKPVSFLLGHNSNSFATPVWYVMWGDKSNGYGVFVNSKTGEVAKRLK